MAKLTDIIPSEFGPVTVVLTTEWRGLKTLTRMGMDPATGRGYVEAVQELPEGGTAVRRYEDTEITEADACGRVAGGVLEANHLVRAVMSELAFKAANTARLYPAAVVKANSGDLALADQISTKRSEATTAARERADQLIQADKAEGLGAVTGRISGANFGKKPEGLQ